MASTPITFAQKIKCSCTAQANVELDKTYPKPIVDHKTARLKALDQYQLLKTVI